MPTVLRGASPPSSAAICAANGVDLREPLKPGRPPEAHDSALPSRSVIVMIVLLNDACTCADAVRHDLADLLARALLRGGLLAERLFAMDYVPFFSDAPRLARTFRVRALV